MTPKRIQPSDIKDILTGILFSMLIIAIMHIMPLFGIFAWVILPLPVLFYRLKTGRNGSGIIVLISLAALIVLTQNIVFNVLYFGALLATGFLLGEFIEKYLPVERIVLFTGLTIAGTFLILLVIYSFSQGQGVHHIILAYIAQYQALLEQLFSESSQLYPQMDMNPADFKKVGSLFAIVFPGILINSYLTMVWINILLIKRLLKKKGIVVQSIENLNRWKAPFQLIFGVIVMSILTFLLSGALKYIAINCLIILLFIYFFQGIAVVSFFFQKKSAPFAIRLFVYILIAIQPFFLTLVIGFGLFDNWANFRKLDTA
ncbi:MAG: YybS family protein [Desulfobacula sp.]|nr:YybS family protein [Desulfobacula sp.]